MLYLKQTAPDLTLSTGDGFVFLCGTPSSCVDTSHTCRSSIKQATGFFPARQNSRRAHIRLILCHRRAALHDDRMRLFIDHPGLWRWTYACDYVSYCFNYRAAGTDCGDRNEYHSRWTWRMSRVVGLNSLESTISRWLRFGICYEKASIWMRNCEPTKNADRNILGTNIHEEFLL